MKEIRPWTFKIHAAEFFSEIESIDPNNHSEFLIQFSKDLLTLKPKTEYGKKVVTETLDFIGKQSNNGRLGGRPKKTQTKGVVNSGLSQIKPKQKVKEEVKEKEEVEIIIPSWLPTSDWNDFLAHRRQIKKPMTTLAQQKMITKLSTFVPEYDPTKILSRAIMNQWQDIYVDESCKPNIAPRVRGLVL